MPGQLFSYVRPNDAYTSVKERISVIFQEATKISDGILANTNMADLEDMKNTIERMNSCIENLKDQKTKFLPSFIDKFYQKTKRSIVSKITDRKMVSDVLEDIKKSFDEDAIKLKAKMETCYSYGSKAEQIVSELNILRKDISKEIENVQNNKSDNIENNINDNSKMLDKLKKTLVNIDSFLFIFKNNIIHLGGQITEIELLLDFIENTYPQLNVLIKTELSTYIMQLGNALTSEKVTSVRNGLNSLVVQCSQTIASDTKRVTEMVSSPDIFPETIGQVSISTIKLLEGVKAAVENGRAKCIETANKVIAEDARLRKELPKLMGSTSDTRFIE